MLKKIVFFCYDHSDDFYNSDNSDNLNLNSDNLIIFHSHNLNSVHDYVMMKFYLSYNGNR